MSPTTSDYHVPRKGILTKEHLEVFQSSETHARIIDYITGLNENVVGIKLTNDCAVSPGITAILDILNRVEAVANEIPPVDNAGSRFGNPAFRSFYDKIHELSPLFHSESLNLPPESISEVSTYFVESWGNRTRIDYGSGMELNFLCWLMCLQHLKVINENDSVAIVIRVFWRYIEVMRVLQSTYWLEPAGSHGVWGLDDYHFLPFLFGSAQLRGHKYLRPKSIHDAEVLEEFSKDYMYLACIQFINSIKTASLRWHSPMLDDISGVKTWDKVNSGMIKMYLAEVLGKLPVIQHFLFGSILPYPGELPARPENAEQDAHWGHSHAHPDPKQGNMGWGDCCGIPIPSVFGSVGEGRAPNSRLQGPAIRPVPFD